MKKLFFYIKRFAPWLVAGFIFYYLFDKYPPAQIVQTLTHVNLIFFVGWVVSYFVIMFFIDTFSISFILRLFGYPESIRELAPARGTTYLIMVLNYAAAQAAFAYYQYRKHGIPVSKMLGIFGIVVVIDLYILAILAFITTFFTTFPFEVWGKNVSYFVRIFTVLAFLLMIGNVFLWRVVVPRFSCFSRLKRFAILELLANTRFSHYLKIFLARLPVHAFIMGGMWLAIQSFNAYIPFTKVLANIPIIFFIGALPITPGGLGATNVALVELMKPVVESPLITSGQVSAGDLLFSFSLAWMFANYLMKALTGMICLKWVSKDLFKPIEKASESPTSPS